MKKNLNNIQKAFDTISEQHRSFYSGGDKKLDQDGNKSLSEDGDEELISQSEMETLNEDITEYEKIKSVGKLL